VVTDIQELIAATDRIAHSSWVPEDADLAEVSRSDELLPGWYEEWVLIERERLRQLRIHALEALGERLIATRKFGRAVEAGLAAVAAEPLRESAHRILIRADLAEGNQAEALRHYWMYRRLLWDELGLRPTSQIEGLIEGMKDSAKMEWQG
jgi:DNA-binding SARP family transcriptional activator